VLWCHHEGIFRDCGGKRGGVYSWVMEGFSVGAVIVEIVLGLRHEVSHLGISVGS